MASTRSASALSSPGWARCASTLRTPSAPKARTMPPAEALPSPIASIDYVARWRDIVERRRAQMDAAYAAAGIDNVDYWGRRAKTYRQALHSRPDEDPLFRRIVRDV